MKRTLRVARPVALLKQGRADWYSIKNVSNSVAEILIYDVIGYFGVTANDFVRDLQGVESDTINLRINSPGGDVFDGIAILNALRNHKATVNGTVEGLAASAASFIAMACDKLTMARNSEMMIHEAAGLAIGNAGNMRELADRLDQVSDNIASIYAERAGGTTDEWRERMRAETWYSADEAVEAKLADEVQGTAKAENSWDLSIFNYAGREHAPTPARNPEAAFDYESVLSALKEVGK